MRSTSAHLSCSLIPATPAYRDKLWVLYGEKQCVRVNVFVLEKKHVSHFDPAADRRFGYTFCVATTCLY